MRLRALDTLHITAAGGRFEAGETFELADYEAAQLVKRGLAEEVATKPSAEKAAPATENKARRASKNKSA